MVEQVNGRTYGPASEDRVSDILKWVLLATAIACFSLLAWATVLTYEKAPPFPRVCRTDSSASSPPLLPSGPVNS